jgi:hypothetical protein
MHDGSFLCRWLNGTCVQLAISSPAPEQLAAFSTCSHAIYLLRLSIDRAAAMARRKASKPVQSRSTNRTGRQAGQSIISSHFRGIRDCGTQDHIDDLPDEILLSIFGFITPTDKRIDHQADPLATWGPEKTTTRDYLSLALTCRKLRPAAITMLYRNYDHNFDHKTPTPLIKRLIAKPELAAMAKDVKEAVVSPSSGGQSILSLAIAPLRAYKPCVQR